MADYQEYRRRILRKRWRRTFAAAGLLVLLILLSAVGLLWKHLHREQSPAAVQGPTIFQQELQSSEWNTISYTPARRTERADHLCRVHRHGFPAGRAGPHHRRGPQLFCQRLFSGRQPDAGDADLFQRPAGSLFLRLPGRRPQRRGQWHHLQALRWRHRGPHGGADSPAAPVLYILLGTNVLNRDGDYSSFLTYYRLMLDMISQALPNTQIYVQSITPVRPEVRSSHPGLYKERLCEINNELAAIALEKNCAFLNLWEALADDNGDLKAEYAQPDGIHIKPEGYPAWVEYLATHTVGQQTA